MRLQKELGLAATLAIVATAGTTAWAQVPFRVARPENGAAVRETVRLQIPRTALKGMQYLTLTIDGKFRAGIDIPPVGEKGKVTRTKTVEANSTTVSLLWDTKALDPAPNLSDDQRVVQDGPHTIEIGAYDPAGKRVGGQTLTLNVNNKGQLPAPSQGILLSYALRIGDQSKYRQKTEVTYIADPQTTSTQPSGRFFNGVPGAAGGGMMGSPGGMMGGGGMRGGGMRGGGMMGGGMMGGPGGMMGGGMMGGPGGMPGGPNDGSGYVPQPRPSGPVSIPVQTVTANYERTIEDYNGGGSFLFRDKATDGVIVAGNGAAARLENIYTFKSRYRDVRPSGYIEQFVPASSAQPGAYISVPVINLGGTRRRVGEQWTVKAPVYLEWATLDKPPMVDTMNRLESLEWQNGYQTARISQTYNGKADIPIFGGAGTMRGADVKMTRTIWFAYRSRRVIRTETLVDVAGNAPANILQAMVPAAGIGASTGLGGMGGGNSLGALGGGDDEGGVDGLINQYQQGANGIAGLLGGGGRGGAGAGFGGQGTQQIVLVPAKFHSNTIITLNLDKPAPRKTIVVIRGKK